MICHCWWEYCVQEADEEIVCGNHGGTFGWLCTEHAEALERMLTRGKTQNEEHKKRHYA